MKKVLFITGSIEENANAVCLNKIRQYFNLNEYEVDILCKRELHREQHDQEIEKGKIFYYDNYYEPIIEKLKKKGIDLYKVNPIIGLPIRIFCRLKTIFLSYIGYKKIIKLENKKNHYSAIISFSMPFNSHVIAEKVKKILKKIKWIAYMYDPLAYNYTLPIERADSRKKIEEKTFKNADKVFLTRGIMEENKKQNYYPNFLDKVVEVDLPNLSEYKTQEVKENNNNMLFVGGFYRDIRNPQKMFQILEKLNTNDMKIKLIGYGCEDLVEDFYKKQPNKVIITGKLSHDKCIQEISAADILLNLGNTIPNQTPSKVFEYISMGKPVINFYELENDTSLFYFSKYSLAFNFNLNNYSDNDIIELEKFIAHNAGKRISFDEAVINLRAYTGESVCKKVFSIVEEII